MLYYFGLEPYEERYTLQLTEWNVREFERLRINFVVVKGYHLREDNDIRVGQVLDAHGRCYYAMSQMQKIIRLMSETDIGISDAMFFEDMFHPGIESLAYIFSQLPEYKRPRIFVRCLAQTIDPDDFTRNPHMVGWMRRYEQMVDEFVTAIFCASEEMVAHIRIAGWKAPCIVTGLPFGKAEVQSRMPRFIFSIRPKTVVFASRTDTEKQPEFFLALAKRLRAYDSEIRCLILSGSKKLRSNSDALLKKILQAQQEGVVEIHEGLSKNAYYNFLGEARVLFNCALQDWVSNTVSEADALGCNVVFPAYRSFPETFGFDETRLYIPWSLDDATHKVLFALEKRHPSHGAISDYQDKTIERTVAAIFPELFPGTNQNVYRVEDGKWYRRNVIRNKFTL